MEHQCNLCENKYSSRHAWKLDRHKYKVHHTVSDNGYVEQPLECDECSYQSDHQIKFQVHLEVLHNVSAKMARRTVASKLQERREDKEAESKTCRCCQVTFPTNKASRQHMHDSHYSGSPDTDNMIDPALGCDKCHKKFENKTVFILHLVADHEMPGKSAKALIESCLSHRAAKWPHLSPARSDHPEPIKGEVKTESKNAIRMAPIGEKAACPVCSEQFSRRLTAIRHLQKKHPMPAEEAGRLILEIPTVRKECRKCGRWLTNLKKHSKKCAGQMNVPNEAVPASNQADVPKDFGTGGQVIMPRFKAYLQKRLAKRTASQYFNKMNAVATFWESSVPNFKVDKLLFPLETSTLVPSVLRYIEGAEDSDAIVAMKAYKNFVAYLKLDFDRYESDGKFSIEQRQLWLSNCTEKVGALENEQKLRKRNLEHKAKDKVADAIEAGTDLTYNHDRLRVVVRDLLNCPGFNKYRKALLEHSIDVAKEMYREVDFRYALAVEVLLSSGGQRPHVVSRMQVGELLSASEEDGHYVVRVRHHKTTTKHGPVCLVLSGDLYRAVRKYLECFRPSTTEDKSYVFATRSGSEMQMGQPVSWVRPYLSGICSDAETKTFLPKSIRKGYSNWAKDHPDEDVNSKALDIMCHSKGVQLSNYNVIKDRSAVKVTSGVLKDVILVGASHTERNGKRSVNAGGFTESEMGLIMKSLCRRSLDGELVPPNGVTNATIDRAIEKYPAFAKLYRGLVKDKGGKRDLANSAIWASIKQESRTGTAGTSGSRGTETERDAN